MSPKKKPRTGTPVTATPRLVGNVATHVQEALQKIRAHPVFKNIDKAKALGITDKGKCAGFQDRCRAPHACVLDSCP